MTHHEFLEKLAENPVIAAVKSDEDLAAALNETDIGIIFVLYGDIVNLPGVTKSIRKKGRHAFVHIDLVSGLSVKDEAAVDYVKQFTEADGIITTRTNIAAHAKEIGLNTVLRFFVIDSKAVNNIRRQARERIQPDVIEIMPGVVAPEVISEIDAVSRVPVLAGGLVRTKEDCMRALGAGATAVSTTNQGLWQNA